MAPIIALTALTTLGLSGVPFHAPDGLAGIHLNFLRRPPPDVLAALLGRAPVPAGFTADERAALDAFGMQARKGYAAEQGESPQTIGYALTDSPAGLDRLDR